MTSVDSTSALVALIRTQLRASRPATPQQNGAQQNGAPADLRVSSRGSPPGRPLKTAADSLGGDTTSDELAGVILQRVGSIASNDPDRRRKAFRVFLEAVLLDEFGVHLVNDAGFHQLVETVTSHMETHGDLAPLIHEATDVLLRSTAAG